MIKNFDEFKNSLDIEKVISEYIPLKKQGANFIGVCPFHADTKPSLIVSPAKNIYHCFACSAGGDAIKFVMENSKLTFSEACKEIADKTNFNLLFDEKTIKKDYSVLTRAKDAYKAEVFKVRKYLEKRGVSEASIDKFELGFGIELNEESFDNKKAYGLNAMISRLVFPIKNYAGRVIGFGGRTMNANGAKYINSPQSAIFNKSAVLYGFFEARNEINRTKEVIICEGYMDAIMAQQAGLKNTVATLGVALTKEHLALIAKFGANVTLVFDNDSAGISAKHRAIELLVKNKMFDSKILLIDSEQKDIADMVLLGQTNALLNARRVPIIQNFIDDCLANLANLSIEQRAGKVDKVAHFINSIDNNFLKKQYEQYLKDTYNIDGVVLKNKATIVHKPYDAVEVGVIQLMSLSSKNKDYVLEYLDINDFYTTKQAFRDFVNGTNTPALREILVMEIPEINLEHSVIGMFGKKIDKMLLETSQDRSLSQENKIQKILALQKTRKEVRAWQARVR
ncbi:DNA primase [Campylobacter hyointestinalis]|uniref:DNA primase n=1 Tax=Campylobacter hyointestinalis subsp. hyointestinalis TaxID=91352 RepID=A0A9W5EYS0_CAMHY|nr:CHC2 zinc finger domain-containing protein [Campylobacter hyointestinalis]CUU74705.1 DNA primase [Campylobacter hyointestinalis subsp. hyointestinalis]CUU82531.1 DNA primase [Campylobacter hyointestinalis subsp. hyointestinalis]